MADPTLADADPVEVVLAWLKDHPQITDLLGGPEHVTGLNEAPYPHVVPDDGPSGDLRGLVWTAEFEVNLDVYGDPDGSPGKAALRKIALSVAKLVADLPDEQVVSPTTPVVSRARPSGTLAYTPLSNGQPRWSVGILVVIHPPLQLPA